MKSKPLLLVIALALVLILPPCAGATTVFETTGWIIGTDGVNYSFVADQAPYTYEATLADLSDPPTFGFDFIYLKITTATESLEPVGSIDKPGSFTFTATPGETYHANLFGIASEEGVNAGLYGIEVATVPIPTTLMLLGSGLVGLVVVRRKKNQQE